MKAVFVLITTSIFLCKVASDNGPCPDFPTMKNFDITKGNSVWKTYSVYATDNEEEKCRCATTITKKLPNNNTFIQVHAYYINKPNVSFEMNATCIPIEGKPGAFNLQYDNETIDFTQSDEKQYNILDTDYENYSIGIGCYGDGITKHIVKGLVDYKDTKPPAHLLEKATLLFKKAGLDISKIKAVEQTNCPNRQN